MEVRSSEVFDSCPNALEGASAQLFLTLINALMASQCAFGPEGRYPTDYGPKLNNGDEFDFIIVGSGSAGSVVANRLSRVPEWKVLLLEAGRYPSAASEIPMMTLGLQNTDEDWQYKTESSETSCISNGGCNCPRGKGLGGSTLLNMMAYTRTTRRDHDLWTDNGIKGWDYDTVLKHYKNIERSHVKGDNTYGKEGELHLTTSRSPHPMRATLQTAYQELGYQEFLTDDQFGFRDTIAAIYQGTRQNSAKAFLSPIKDSRKNLFVAINAQVSKLIIDDQHLIVKGVEVHVNGQLLSLKANKEVILSAGSINSPQILMNSGIGPKEHLEEVGVKVLKDLRVGENYQDHVAFYPLAIGVDHSAVVPNWQESFNDEIYKYFMHRQGILGTTDLAAFLLFMNTKNDTAYANMEYVNTLISQKDDGGLSAAIRAFNLPLEIAEPLKDYNQNYPILFITPISLHPKSTGFVRLRNTDPFSKPLIIPNFFSDEKGEDLEVLLEAIHFIQRLIGTKSFGRHSPKIIKTTLNNCKSFVPLSDDYWRCALKNAATTLFHPIGTCKMGAKHDPTAVVDSRLRVIGVKGVRVIDGSVIPIATSSHPSATIMMIGDKGATLIQEDWLQKSNDI